MILTTERDWGKMLNVSAPSRFPPFYNAEMTKLKSYKGLIAEIAEGIFFFFSPRPLRLNLNDLLPILSALSALKFSAPSVVRQRGN